MTGDTTWKQANVAAAMALCVCCLFGLYKWNYGAMVTAASGMDVLTAMLRADAQPDKVATAQTVPQAATAPEILSRIQEAASADAVVLHSVMPDQANKDQLNLAAAGDFRDMIRFVGRLETLPVNLVGFDMAPDEQGHISLSVSLAKAAAASAPANFADYIDAMALYTAIRDPFAVGDPVPMANAGSDMGDLSWTYHLTSISLLGAARVATIDGKDYEVGDTLNGMAVTAIGPSSVALKTADNAIQKIHFRRNPQERQ